MQLPWTGHSLAQPIVECSAPTGECVTGTVVLADWFHDGDFDRDSTFVVRTDDGELVRVNGWAVDVELIG